MPNCNGSEKCAAYCANCNRRSDIEKGCIYCDFSSGDVGARINTSGNNFVMIKSEYGISLATGAIDFRMLKINYCPMCGRKFKNND